MSHGVFQWSEGAYVPSAPHSLKLSTVSNSLRRLQTQSTDTTASTDGGLHSGARSCGFGSQHVSGTAPNSGASYLSHPSASGQHSPLSAQTPGSSAPNISLPLEDADPGGIEQNSGEVPAATGSSKRVQGNDHAADAQQTAGHTQQQFQVSYGAVDGSGEATDTFESTIQHAAADALPVNASTEEVMAFVDYQLDLIYNKPILNGLQLLGNGPRERLQGGAPYCHCPDTRDDSSSFMFQFCS